MEPISNIELAKSVLLSLWPLWFVLAALAVVWLASHLGFCAPDEYEDPAPQPRPNSQWMTEEERRYHEGNGWGR